MTVKRRRIAAVSVLAVVMAALAFWGAIALTSATVGRMPPLREGDIVFQTMSTSQSPAIIAASRSLYTHTGIVRERDGALVVAEAAGPVREIPLQQWIDSGIAGRLTVMRRTDLDPGTARAVLAAAREYYGRGYDFYFSFDNDTIYCSELVYLAFRRAGITIAEPQRIGDLGVHNAITERLLKQRWKNHPACRDIDDFTPCRAAIMQQTLITPAAIAAAPGLETVYSNYLTLF